MPMGSFLSIFHFQSLPHFCFSRTLLKLNHEKKCVCQVGGGVIYFLA